MRRVGCSKPAARRVDTQWRSPTTIGKERSGRATHTSSSPPRRDPLPASWQIESQPDCVSQHMMTFESTFSHRYVGRARKGALYREVRVTSRLRTCMTHTGVMRENPYLYVTLSRTSPTAGAAVPPARLSRLARISRKASAGKYPRAMSTIVPTSERTIPCTNRSAAM
jgi:hypothetical protein